MILSSKRCPIHKRTDCCGRTSKSVQKSKKWTQIGPGVFRIEDPRHPRGYRIRRSPAAMRYLVDKKIIAQEGKCSICRTEFTDRREVGPDHVEPRGAGGAFRDDHEDNIEAAHNLCNLAKGSRRIA